MGKAPKKNQVGDRVSAAEERFVQVVASFSKDADVSRGGKGFGSTGLKVEGKLFAFISSKGKFVVKVPRERVVELVAAAKAEHFDPGHGRLMKEWIAVAPRKANWVQLAREAYRFVKSSVR